VDGSHDLLATLYDSDSFWRYRVVAAWALTHSPLTANQRSSLGSFLCDSLGQRSLLSFHPLIQLIMLVSVERDLQIRLAFLHALQHLRVPTSVETLADIACHTHSELRCAAEHALLAALPTLTTDHYGQFSLETVPNLCRILTGERPAFPVASEALLLATLNALEKIGDGRAVSAVRHTAVASYVSCVEEAQRILPVLLERQERERHRGMLLRASSAPETNTDQLLRPAGDTTTAPEQLLRPVTNSEDVGNNRITRA
jgi:hypothetical protein